MTKIILPYVFLPPLTYFFMHFTAIYLWYFDIGINQGMRTWDICVFRAPVAFLAQVAAIAVADKFIKGHRWRLALHLAILLGVLALTFAGFALTDHGIPRQGGFLRFLGYYFLNLEPGRMPDGTWQ